MIKEHPQSPSDAIIIYMRTEINTPFLSESSTAYLHFLRDKMRDDEEWTPPTEAELKVLASRRERSDKISKLMGDYMLKGYRMLATLCPICECVELQDRQGAKYCVACQEVDCQETSKDNPALSQQAASGVRAEGAFAIGQPSSPSISIAAALPGELAATVSPTTSAATATIDPDLIPRNEGNNGATPKLRHEKIRGQLQTSTQSWSSSVRSVAPEEIQPLLANSLAVVAEKLSWANLQLQQEEDIVRASQLAVLVRELSHTPSNLLLNR